MRVPVVVTRKRGAAGSPPSKKSSCYMIVFPILLLIVAAMSFWGMARISSASSAETSPKTVSLIIKESEEKIAETAGKFISAGQQYLHDHMLRTGSISDTTSPILNSVIHPEATKSSRKRIAYAITITKDGFFQDGAAVLAYSIMKYANVSSYDISLIAFVHPNVSTSRVGLRRLGFHVIEVPTPVNTSAIQFPFLRDHIDKNGCCGAAELIKLTSYRCDSCYIVMFYIFWRASLYNKFPTT